jgi:transposase
VDELQYAKGHKYLTLVYQIDQDLTRLLRVGRERTIESFQGFFTLIGEKLVCAGIHGNIRRKPGGGRGLAAARLAAS